MFSIEIKEENKAKFIKYISLNYKNIIDNDNFILVQDELPNTYEFMASYNDYYYNFNDNKIKIKYNEEGTPKGGTMSELKYFTRLVVEYDNLDILKDFITTAMKFIKKDIKDNKISIYISKSRGYWDKYDRIFVQSIDNIYFDKKIKQSLINDLDMFMSSVDKYNKFGKLHKYNILLYGIQGSGKTSIAKALALKYNYSLHVINFTKLLNNDSLIELMSNIEDNALILYEDIDTYFNNRDNMNSEVSYSCFTNILDGTMSKSNSVITIMTANNINFLDKPFLRQGRIDKIIKFDYPKKDEIEEVYNSLINDDNFEIFYNKIKLEKITMSGIIDYLFKYTYNYMTNINDLISHNNSIKNSIDIYS